MPALGHRGYYGVATETAWGNGTASAFGWQYSPIKSEAIKHVLESENVTGIRASREDKRKVVLGIKAGGPVGWDVDVEDAVGVYLKHTLPNEAFTDNGSGNGGIHVFTPGDANLPAGLCATINRDVTPDANNIWLFYGGRVKKLSFSAQDGGILQGNVDIDFKKGTPASGNALTPSYTTQNPLVYHQGAITIAGVSVPVKSFKLDIDTGLLINRGQLGSQYNQQQQPAMYKVTGEVDVYFDTLAQVTAFMASTDINITLNFLGTALGTSTRQLKFEIPSCYFKGETPSIANPQEIMLKLPFTAYRSGSGSPDNLIAVTLLNSIRTVYS